jgi:hypothetical protein
VGMLGADGAFAGIQSSRQRFCRVALIGESESACRDRLYGLWIWEGEIKTGTRYRLWNYKIQVPVF